MFSVCMCAIYQVCPKESYLKILKRILRYLSGMTNFGLWYPNERACCLVEFLYSDFTGCKSDKKSTNGTCHLFEIFLVSDIVKRNITLLFQLQRLNNIMLLFLPQRLNFFDLTTDSLLITTILCLNYLRFNYCSIM